MTVPTQEQIASSLKTKGTNLCAWSKANDYNYPTVHTVVKRWAGRNDRTPHGGIARKIMSDLDKYVRNSERYGQVD